MDAVANIVVVGVLNCSDFHRVRVATESVSLTQPSITVSIKPLRELAFLQFKKSQAIDSPAPVLVWVNDTLLDLPAFFALISSQFAYKDVRPRALYGAMANDAAKKARNPDREYVFLEFSSAGQSLGKVVIELFNDITPKTCANFRALCTGESGSTSSGAKLHYLSTPVHRVVPAGWLQAGDIISGSGAEGASIYGPVFADENFVVPLARRGMLAMANHGLNTNASQFFIALAALPSFSGKYVAFGEVIEGDATLAAVERLPLVNGRPSACVISACGKA